MVTPRAIARLVVLASLLLGAAPLPTQWGSSIAADDRATLADPSRAFIAPGTVRTGISLRRDGRPAGTSRLSLHDGPDAVLPSDGVAPALATASAQASGHSTFPDAAGQLPTRPRGPPTR